MFAQRKITICALINKKAPSEERGLFYGNFFKFVLVNLRLRLYVCFCLLRWRRCHAVTEVDKVLPAIKLSKHYGYSNTSTPKPPPAGDMHRIHNASNFRPAMSQEL